MASERPIVFIDLDNTMIQAVRMKEDQNGDISIPVFSALDGDGGTVWFQVFERPWLREMFKVLGLVADLHVFSMAGPLYVDAALQSIGIGDVFKGAWSVGGRPPPFGDNGPSVPWVLLDDAPARSRGVEAKMAMLGGADVAAHHVKVRYWDHLGTEVITDLQHAVNDTLHSLRAQVEGER